MKKKGKIGSVIVDYHGKFASEEPDLDLEFGFPVCPECFSADIFCEEVAFEGPVKHFCGILEVRTRYRTCFCENCECRFRQIGKKKYHFKPLNLILWGSWVAIVAGLVLPFVFDEGTFVMLFAFGLVVLAICCDVSDI